MAVRNWVKHMALQGLSAAERVLCRERGREEKQRDRKQREREDSVKEFDVL